MFWIQMLVYIFMIETYEVNLTSFITFWQDALWNSNDWTCSFYFSSYLYLQQGLSINSQAIYVT